MMFTVVDYFFQNQLLKGQLGFSLYNLYKQPLHSDIEVMSTEITFSRK